jgi:hypothetical protein
MKEGDHVKNLGVDETINWSEYQRVGREAVDWFHLDLRVYQWRTLAYTVMNVQTP